MRKGDKIKDHMEIRDVVTNKWTRMNKSGMICRHNSKIIFIYIYKVYET